MSTCGECNVSGSSEEPLVVCNGCSAMLCKSCADLTTTEYRAIVLKKRSKSIIYHCSSCLVAPASLNFSSLRDSILEKLREEFLDLSESLSKLLLSELDTRFNDVCSKVTCLKDSNVQLVKLLTGPWKQTNKSSDLKTSDGGEEPQANYNLSTPQHSQRPDRKSSDSSQVVTIDAAVTSRQQPSSLTAPAHTSNVRRSKSSMSTAIVGSGKVGTGISAANIPKKTSMLVSRLDKSVSSDDLQGYLKATFGDTETFSIEEQTVRSGDYRSFKVELKVDLLDDFLCPSKWPQGVMVKKFRFFHRRRTPAI